MHAQPEQYGGTKHAQSRPCVECMKLLLTGHVQFQSLESACWASAEWTASNANCLLHAADIDMLGGVHKAVLQLDPSVSVIWKLTAEDQKLLKAHQLDVPKHVFVSSFTPQNDVLGHQSVRGFVTQGGSNSILEVRFICLMVILHKLGKAWISLHTKHVKLPCACCSTACTPQAQLAAEVAFM